MNNINWIITSAWLFICGLIGYGIFPELEIWGFLIGMGTGFVLTIIGTLFWFEVVDKKRSEIQINEHREMLDRHFKEIKQRNEIAERNWGNMTNQERQNWRNETQLRQDLQEIEYKASFNRMFPEK